jgi:hypothetical protein
MKLTNILIVVLAITMLEESTKDEKRDILSEEDEKAFLSLAVTYFDKNQEQQQAVIEGVTALIKKAILIVSE